jgi:hypothetical protein
MTRYSYRKPSTLALAALLLAIAATAEAQQSMRDVLSFLVTNRTIPTDDFVLELSWLPSSSGGGSRTGAGALK